MTASHTANGLASLGRHGDSMLVHMNPTEVAGLQSLAKANGTSLTVNPETGMPEAFSLKGLFKAALPMIAGFALGPGGFGLMSSALGSGLLVGGLTGLMTGDVGKGIMAGFGAYGGHGLGGMFSKLGTAGATNPTTVANTTQAATGAPLVGASSQFISPFTPQGIAGGAGLGVGTVGGGAANAITNQAVNAGLTGANTVANAGNIAGNIANTANVAAPVSGFQRSLEGVKSLGQEGGWDRAKNILGTPGKAETLTGVTKDAAGNVVQSTYSPATAGTPLTDMQMIGKVAPTAGGLALGAYKDKLMPEDTPYADKQKRIQTGTDAQGNPIYTYMAEAAYSPYETLNLNNPLANYPDRKPALGLILPETRLAAEGGMINSYALGGAVNVNPPVGSGISDLYNRPEGSTTQSISSDGYGIGRLNNLAGEQAMTQAQTLGYAQGGYLNGQGDGMSDSIPATIEGKQPARLADGEFVVPADVVSHLGNGSSKAGSKRLYAMLDKIRHARTGTKKQGKQINPSKYMPA